MMRFYIGSGLKNYELVRYYAKKLEENGWSHTYDWTRRVRDDVTGDALCKLALQEQTGVLDADVVVILLPAGRGAHIELGMALAHHKKIFLCAAGEDEFRIENMVSFYLLPELVRLVGTADENVKKIISMNV